MTNRKAYPKVKSARPMLELGSIVRGTLKGKRYRLLVVWREGDDVHYKGIDLATPLGKKVQAAIGDKAALLKLKPAAHKARMNFTRKKAK